MDNVKKDERNIWLPQFQEERKPQWQQAKQQRNMSASYLVDLGSTTQMAVSIQDGPILSGSITAPCSGAIIGQGINMINSDSYCNLFVAGVTASGQLRVQVQSSDTDTSGTYTDPTSGLPNLPGAFQSGGLLWINSGGLLGGVLGSGTSGQYVASGFATSQAFLRPGTFARANLLSGDFAVGGFTIGFISQLKTTGSGGGFSFQPSSGTVNV